MIERRRTITGPGGEIAYYERRTTYRNERRCRKNCQTGTWVVRKVDSIVPLGWISNVFPCQMVEHIYNGGNYVWEKLPL